MVFQKERQKDKAHDASYHLLCLGAQDVKVAFFFWNPKSSICTHRIQPWRTGWASPQTMKYLGTRSSQDLASLLGEWQASQKTNLWTERLNCAFSLRILFSEEVSSFNFRRDSCQFWWPASKSRSSPASWGQFFRSANLEATNHATYRVSQLSFFLAVWALMIVMPSLHTPMPSLPHGGTLPKQPPGKD